MRALLGLEEADPDVVLGELAGLLAVQEHLCIWFLNHLLGSLERYYDDPGERWRLLRELVHEALGVSESSVYLHGAHLTSMGIVVRDRLHELARKRIAEALNRAGNGKAQPEERQRVGRGPVQA